MTKETSTMTPQPILASARLSATLRSLGAAAILAACAFLLLAPSSLAATPAPAWTITSTALPTNFAPDSTENAYRLTVINAGGAAADPSSEPITVSDTLPPGLTATAISALNQDFSTSGTSCTLATLTCTFTGTIEAGRVVSVYVTVSVPAGAPEGSVVNSATVSGGGAASVSASETTTISASPAAFGLDSFASPTVEADGSPARQAGDHPYATTATFFLNTVRVGGSLWPAENPRDVVTELPPGLVGNPTAVPRCLEQQMQTGQCPIDSQVGEATVFLTGGTNDAVAGLFDNQLQVPVYNAVPQEGSPAEFVFVIVNVPQRLVARVRSDGDYGITILSSGITEDSSVIGASVTFWGVPGDPSHDPVRGLNCQGSCGYSQPTSGGMPFTGLAVKPLLSNPTRCDNPLTTTLNVVSWQNPGGFAGSLFGTPGLIGCDRLAFEPSISLVPDTRQANAPSGVDVDLSVPQTDAVGTLATPALKDATVTLPRGVTLSPAIADGLQGCTPAQIALRSLAPGTCPDASKLGTVKIVTPLLPDPLEGSVFLGTPDCSPCTATDAQSGRLAHGYIEAAGQGVRVKLPGSFAVDPQTGQIAAHFDDNPQLPFSDLKLHFFGGPRGPLTTPPGCGSFSTHSVLTPWSAPYTPDAIVDGAFTIDQSCDAAQGFAPSLAAGVGNPRGGDSSPFTLTLSRDGGENVAGLDVTLPPGLLAKLAGVPQCPEAQAASGSCDAASQIGHATVAAGPGSAPLYVPQAGKPPTAVYLAGPYKGAPFSLVIKVPAQAGPFDLGTVVVRAALYVDATDAHVTVKSDPLPQILDGIPLEYRKINVVADRPGFMINPTNCTATQISADVAGAPLGGPVSVDAQGLGFSGADGAHAHVSSRFQVGECGSLAFAPKIAMAFTNRSQVHKRKKPGLDFRLSQKSGEANIKSVTVKLPRALVLDVNGASGALCEVAQAENGTCPASSIVGHATAVTPLLDQPLTGAVYFVRGDNALPNIMVALRGQISINLHSKSKVDKMGRLISTFGTVPDAPISQFHLTLGSAGHGVLSVAPDSDLCTGHNSKGKVSIGIVGQNGKSESLSLKIKTPCKKPRKHRR